VNRLDFLRRSAALVVATRFRWVEQAFASTQGTLAALVDYVVADEKLVVTATPRLIRTLDRFLPGPQPLSATAASILDGAAAQVKPGATFAQLNRAQKAQVFATLERLPVESAGSIRFLVGNLQDLTAFVAYSTQRGRRLARYAGGGLHGHKEFKGYWHA
jgi:phospholipase/lecithinase/hemolysin